VIIGLIVYQLFFRRKRPKDNLPKLTEKEKDELIAQWVPEPLVPDTEVTDFDTIGKNIDGHVSSDSVKLETLVKWARRFLLTVKST
jgi:hypothetical protein